MLKNLSISQKLIGGFLIIALITAIVGGIGWFGIGTLGSEIRSLGKESIPSIIHMDDMLASFKDIKTAMRSLLSPYLDDADFQRQYDNIADARSNYASALKSYNTIRHTKEEEVLLKEYLDSIERCKEMNNKYLEMAKEMHNSRDKSAIGAKLSDLGIRGEQQRLFSEMLEANKKLRDYIVKHYGEDVTARALESSLIYNGIVITTSVIGVILALILGIFIAGSISRPVTKMNDSLYTSANSLEGAAGQVSSSSQELSSGASELASSVEEMTSSLEELQSIIEANTKNINEAELLMTETNEGTKSSAMKMDDMQAAMVDINDNSKKIVKIIKVIDDIAFQTNILALNAAVEAARAGDAGRGFAVVAEQVKNLAQKSAEAAKETADLIDRAIDSVAKGEQRGGEVREVLNKAVDLAAKVGVLLDEINRASKEQLKGANQVTKAVTQINTVVQGTAASSEETASAGEEMLSQSEMLKTVVNNLNSLIKGGKAAQKSNPQIKSPLVHTESPRLGKGKQAEKPSREPSKPLLSNEEIEIVKPEDKIPLQDFKDF